MTKQEPNPGQQTAQQEPIAFSNGIRLNIQQWIGVGLFTAALVVFAPAVWTRTEDFTLEPDYRMPFDQSQDYWLFERFAILAAAQYDTLVLGDSVIWGPYVTREETLSHYLNQAVGKQRFANLGLNGAHPLALSGLIEHYAGSIRGKIVLLQCNPLWLTSAKEDLQMEDDAPFFHPRLIPQFTPNIPRYKEEISHRLGVLVEQRFPFNQWTNHLQQSYYHGKDIPAWTLEQPNDNPLEPLTRGLPLSDNKARKRPIPWTEDADIKDVDFPWVDLNRSLQWQAFQRVVETLQRRGNRVFVLVGPFNEHMLTPASRERYQAAKTTIAAWLKDKQVAHAVPPPLPTEQYGDASHPLAAGYANLAGQLLKNPAFDIR